MICFFFLPLTPYPKKSLPVRKDYRQVCSLPSPGIIFSPYEKTTDKKPFPYEKILPVRKDYRQEAFEKIRKVSPIPRKDLYPLRCTPIPLYPKGVRGDFFPGNPLREKSPGKGYYPVSFLGTGYYPLRKGLRLFGKRYNGVVSFTEKKPFPYPESFSPLTLYPVSFRDTTPIPRRGTGYVPLYPFTPEG